MLDPFLMALFFAVRETSVSTAYKISKIPLLKIKAGAWAARDMGGWATATPRARSQRGHSWKRCPVSPWGCSCPLPRPPSGALPNFRALVPHGLCLSTQSSTLCYCIKISGNYGKWSLGRRNWIGGGSSARAAARKCSQELVLHEAFSGAHCFFLSFFLFLYICFIDLCGERVVDLWEPWIFPSFTCSPCLHHNFWLSLCFSAQLQLRQSGRWTEKQALAPLQA